MQEILGRRKFLLATVDRIEGTKAVLKFDDGQSLDWPMDSLAGDIAEGSQVKLVMFSNKGEEEEREEMAKAAKKAAETRKANKVNPNQMSITF